MMDRARRCEEWDKVSSIMSATVDVWSKRPQDPLRFNPYKIEKPKPPKPEISPFLRWL